MLGEMQRVPPIARSGVNCAPGKWQAVGNNQLSHIQRISEPHLHRPAKVSCAECERSYGRKTGQSEHGRPPV